jgi:lantibiotic leader peptide-processing serine protease
MKSLKGLLVSRRTQVVIIAALSLPASVWLRAQDTATSAATFDRLIVVFRSERLPSDAAAIVQAAGGRVLAELPDIGVVIAEPHGSSGMPLRDRLLAAPGILDVGSDWIVSADPGTAIGPGQDVVVQPQSHFPHPLPTFSPALPPDFFYTSSPQQWPAKRIGAAGGGVPTPVGDPTVGAWDATFGAGVKIAIIDTGLNPLHPDLSGKVVFARAVSHATPLLGDVNCEVPDPSSLPFDLPVDQHGHGTWVASLAAGRLGGGLLVGVAPEAQLLSIKMLRRTPAPPEVLQAAGIPPTPYYRCLFGGGFGLGSWFLQAILLASEQGADVVSMSLGGLVTRSPQQSPEPAAFRALHRAVNRVTARGALLVAAAQNFRLDLDKVGPLMVVPAQLPNVIAVVATTNPDCVETATPFEPCVPGPEKLASYSNHGARLNALAAPGGAFPFGFCGFNGVPCFETGFVVGACSAGIAGTTPPDPATFPAAGPPPTGTSFGCVSAPFQPNSLVPVPGFDQHMWYIWGIGTSAATPLVAATAALVKATRPELRTQQLRAILQQTAEDLGKPGYDDLFNFGLVDAAAAVRTAQR